MKTHFLKEGDTTLNALIRGGLISETAAKDIEYSLALGPNRRDTRLHYVGLVETQERQLFFLPKYCTFQDEKHAKTVIQLLRRTAESSSVASVFPDAHLFHPQQSEGLLSKVELASLLLEDFYSFGPLTLRVSRLLKSTDREPDWSRTFDRTEPMWTGRDWVYDQWISKKQTSVDQHLVADIHLHVIAECHARYGELLGYPAMTAAAPRTLPNENRVKALLNASMRREYVARHIKILKALSAWLFSTNTPVKPVSYFGTRYFEHVWEQCCSYLMRDCKDAPHWKELMPFPSWFRSSEHISYTAEGRFQLDSLTELPSQQGILISDAKYYAPRFSNGKALGVPGMESLSKQVHYEEIVRRSATYLGRYSATGLLLNAFVLPERSDSSLVWVSGWVEVESMTSRPIVCIGLNPLQAFERYLQRRHFSDEELENLCQQALLCRS